MIWAAAEICATIIATCIPVLRTLVRDLSSSGRATGPTGGYIRSTADDLAPSSRRHHTKLGGTNVVAISASHGTDGMSPDEASDKSILASSSFGGKIVKTSEVALTRGDGTGVGYEMDQFSRDDPKGLNR